MKKVTTIGLMLSTVLISSLALPSTANAARSCTDNLEISGDRNTGTRYSSFIEVDGELEPVFLTVGQAIAAEGFAGINASKDLGVISAYQDTNGKRSPVNATVRQAQPGRVRVELTLQLAPGLISPISSVKSVVCDILESVLSEDERAAAAAYSSLALQLAESEEVPLPMTGGTLRQAGMFPVVRIYSDLDGDRSAIRTSQRRPVVVVRESEDPLGKYCLVRFESDRSGNRRELKMMSGAKLLKAAFTGEVDYAPDEDWMIELSSTQAASGEWHLSPTSDLEPGEYGVWDFEGMAVAPFGVGE